MLVDDARELAAAMGERLHAGAAGQTVKVTVKSHQLSPKSIPAGAGRPTFVRYYIRIDDGSRMATLDLGQAGGLLDEVEPDWDSDRLFAAIRARDVPVEDSDESDPQ